MKKLISLFLMGVTALAATAAIAGDYAAQKVVYHVNYDDAKRQSGAMRNIQNHINAVGKENLDLRVVMHGKGVSLLKKANTDPDFKQKVDNLKDQGVKFNVCANTLRGKKIDYKTQLHDVDQNDIVPSGVAEIAKLEQEGFAYIRP
jgi:intracellular sulfur oxidation DsrE/DsrF family protein